MVFRNMMFQKSFIAEFFATFHTPSSHLWPLIMNTYHMSSESYFTFKQTFAILTLIHLNCVDFHVFLEIVSFDWLITNWTKFQLDQFLTVVFFKVIYNPFKEHKVFVACLSDF